MTKLKFEPLNREAQKSKAVTWALGFDSKRAGAVNTWYCPKSKFDPTPETTEVTARAYLSFMDLNAPQKASVSQVRQYKARMERFFYAKVVQRNRDVYQSALDTAFGVYKMTIPVRRLLLPDYQNYVALLQSQVTYAHFRVNWLGVKRKQWVVLSLPIGHEHAVSAFSKCDGQGREVLLSSDELIYLKLLETANYQPKTKNARTLYVADRKTKIGDIESDIKDLEAKKKQLQEELESLSQD